MTGLKEAVNFGCTPKEHIQVCYQVTQLGAGSPRKAWVGCIAALLYL